MDEDRRIRFMVAPLLFLASLAWGIVRDPSVQLSNVLPGVEVNLKDVYGLVAAVAGGGLALFPLGFVIGTTTYVLLRLVALAFKPFRRGSGCHEIVISERALSRVWRAIAMPGDPDPEQELFAGVTFDHEVLLSKHEGVHRWLMRRWNAFSVAITSVTALVLSLVTGHAFGIGWRADWQAVALAVCGILLVSAFLAWKDTMMMLTFQAERLANQGTAASNQGSQPTPKGGAAEPWGVELIEKPNEAGPKTETRDMTNRNQKRSTFG